MCFSLRDKMRPQFWRQNAFSIKNPISLPFDSAMNIERASLSSLIMILAPAFSLSNRTFEAIYTFDSFFKTTFGSKNGGHVNKGFLQGHRFVLCEAIYLLCFCSGLETRLRNKRYDTGGQWWSGSFFGLTIILVIPLSARFGLARWGLGRIGWATGQGG